jgi:hypothetical protein
MKELCSHGLILEEIEKNLPKIFPDHFPTWRILTIPDLHHPIPMTLLDSLILIFSYDQLKRTNGGPIH